jgi:uncharacterized protein YbbC (DUF1343 family)
LRGEYAFTPVSIPGVSENPKFKGRTCYGKDLSHYEPVGGWTRLYLQWLLDAYREFPRKEEFFTSYFESLAGTSRLREQIEAGWDESRIRESWREDLEVYSRKRKNYLIYP